MYRERFASTPHTPSFYKAAFWVFVLFVYAKTVILNKYVDFRGSVRLRVDGVGQAAPGFHLPGSSVVSSLLAPTARRLGVWGGGQQVTAGKDQCWQPQSEETVPAVAPMGLRARCPGMKTRRRGKSKASRWKRR